MKPHLPAIDIGTHGFLKLDEVMGEEHDIVRAARVSFDMDDKAPDPGPDENLIRRLMRHRHTTPFEQVSFRFIVQCPMDLWRQWIRHRTAKVNEYSTRYRPAIDFRAVTGPDEWRAQSSDSKQGSLGFLDRRSIGTLLTERELELHELSDSVYKERLEAGVAREQARKDLPLSTYTRAYWKMDVHNLFHFLGLRLALDAQSEIRQFANAIASFIEPYVPMSYRAFTDYHLNAITFSGPELRVFAAFPWTGIADLQFTDDSGIQLGLSKTECKELRNKLEYLKGLKND